MARANPLGTLRAFRGERLVLGLGSALFVWQIAFHVYPSTWSYFAIARFQMSSGAIGATLAMSGISMALVQSTLTGRVVNRFGERFTALLGVAWGSLIFALYAFAPEAWMLFPLLALSGLQGIASPAMNALMSRELGPERQGELQGGLASVMGLSSIIGPIAHTQVLARFSDRARPPYFPGAAFILAASLGVVCFVILCWQLRRRP